MLNSQCRIAFDILRTPDVTKQYAYRKVVVRLHGCSPASSSAYNQLYRNLPIFQYGDACPVHESQLYGNKTIEQWTTPPHRFRQYWTNYTLKFEWSIVNTHYTPYRKIDIECIEPHSFLFFQHYCPPSSKHKSVFEMAIPITPLFFRLCNDISAS